jgi:alkanesulfonate monooxygenase SsuD/methylene tetrahydromethanopterin reductase-like flavin-dependent oxidoreductase (luciferase family)
MRLKTNVLIMPLVHAIDTAENVATLDHICGGRLDVGLGIGYREKELEAAGVTRKDRVPKLEESIDLMKRLWAGEEVTVTGRYHRLNAGRLGFTPVQKPHPPIEIAAQSVAATQRAARMADAVFFGPQVAWRDVEKLTGVFRDARAQAGATTPGTIYASRSLIVGPSKEKAAAAAKEFLQKTFNTYRAWDMQERSMVPLQLGFDVNLDDWAVNGSPRDCVEAVARAREMGLDGIGFTMYALPREVDARIEYLQMISEEVLKPAGAFEGV